MCTQSLTMYAVHCMCKPLTTMVHPISYKLSAPKRCMCLITHAFVYVNVFVYVFACMHNTVII